ncbi:glycosyltransferase family 87 protein [Gordonia sp. FQ]|uniref:glycosyltransferase family 87 protein n=1 Tax=Gordonia sp. FQ TaxID=3446634 RepID=UPI003F82F93D
MNPESGPDTAERTPSSSMDDDAFDSPAPLADDRRLNTERVLPSRSNAQIAVASEAIGGPVGLHAAVGRGRHWTPLRVVFLLALIALGLSWYGKAGCLQQKPAHPADQSASAGQDAGKQLNWNNQRQYYGLCYSDVIAFYDSQRLTIADLRNGTMPYRTYWFAQNAAGEQVGPRQYVSQPVLVGAFMYVAAKATQGWQALVDGTPIPKQLDVVTFFNISALLLALLWLLAVWATMMTDRRRIWIGALMACSPLLLIHAFTAYEVIPVAMLALAMMCWAHRREVLAGLFLGLAASAALYPLLLIPVLAVVCLRNRRMHDFWAAIACAVIAWLTVNLPLLISYPQGTTAFYRDWWQRVPQPDSLYNLVIKATGWAPSTSLVNALALILLVAVICGVVYLAARVPAPMPGRIDPVAPAQLMFLLVAGYLLVGKEWNPQSSLWLVPLAVLAIPHARLLLAWMVIDALVWVPRMTLFLDPGRKWLPEEWFLVAVAVRAIFVLVLCGVVIRDLLTERAPAAAVTGPVYAGATG